MRRPLRAYCPVEVADACAFSLRIRRAVLEAALRSRKDFHTALKEFEDWLERVETTARQLDHDSNNTQLVKDSHKRRDWMEGEKVGLSMCFFFAGKVGARPSIEGEKKDVTLASPEPLNSIPPSVRSFLPIIFRIQSWMSWSNRCEAGGCARTGRLDLLFAHWRSLLSRSLVWRIIDTEGVGEEGEGKGEGGEGVRIAPIS